MTAGQIDVRMAGIEVREREGGERGLQESVEVQSASRIIQEFLSMRVCVCACAFAHLAYDSPQCHASFLLSVFSPPPIANILTYRIHCVCVCEPFYEPACTHRAH